MSEPHPATPLSLGIQSGSTVRLVGGTPELEEALRPLPDGVTVTTLSSEPARIGLILVDDDNDLRERLFTELSGLGGADHVWVLADTATGPSIESITAEAELLAWQYIGEASIDPTWTAVEITHASTATTTP